MTLTTHGGNAVVFKQRKGKPTEHTWQREPSLEDLKQFVGWLMRLRKRDIELRRRAAAAEDELQAWRSHAHDLRSQLSALEMRAMRGNDEYNALHRQFKISQSRATEYQQALLDLRGGDQPGDASEPRPITPPETSATEPGFPTMLENPLGRGDRRIVRSAAQRDALLAKWGTTEAAATAAAGGKWDEARALHDKHTPTTKPILRAWRWLLAR